MDSVENKIINIIKKYTKPEIIYLFGSYLTERFNLNSDIDIAFLSKENICFEDMNNMKIELESKIEREIDIINLNEEKSMPLIGQIIFKGKVIFTTDENKKNEFEYRKISVYGQYIDDMQIIIKKIKDRGYIYERDNIVKN